MSYSKKVLICLYRILWEKTDENHTLVADELIRELKNYGYSPNRKTIYSYLSILQDVGVDVIQKKGVESGYYIGRRLFEMPELKLFVDAVQASNFITEKKSELLISKLENLASKYQAEQLRRNVIIRDRPKTNNERIYYNVDQIQQGILNNRKVKFQYLMWNEKGELVLKNNGKAYVVNPWALIWDDENYYMVGYDENCDEIRHYRVDKMQSTEVTSKRRVGKHKFANFDVASFSKKTFGMYGGLDQRVLLRCDCSIMGVIFDRFGKEVAVIPAENGYYKVLVTVTVSPQFFAWITGLGKRVRIISPDTVKEKYVSYLMEIAGEYI